MRVCKTIQNKKYSERRLDRASVIIISIDIIHNDRSTVETSFAFTRILVLTQKCLTKRSKKPALF